jgi:GDPmannose 4,6-dehydratase
MKRALIIGVDGQDGSYLAELLLSKNYEVIGWIPANITVSLRNIEHLTGQVQLVKGDLLSQSAVIECLEEYQPDEIYNLAAPSFPAGSWNLVDTVGEVAGLGVARLLEAVRLAQPTARFYQASTSEIFGNPREAPQNETTPFNPRNPYGIAKLYGHWMTVNFREHYGLYAVSGILFNHTSPRQGIEFVVRKIAHEAARIKLSMCTKLSLGNLDARRDWGFAGDYVEAMWLMLQYDHPEDFVVGTGETHSVRELCELAFGSVGLEYQDYVLQDAQLFRSEETRQLVADPAKVKKILNWKPRVSFDQLVKTMVDADLKALSRDSKK